MAEETQKNRVLHITEELSAAGIESFIMNLYRRIDRTKVQFDFLVMRDTKEYYEEEILSMGGRKFCIEQSGNNLISKIQKESRQIEAFLKEHPYKVVHIHCTTPMRAPYLQAAANAGVPVRIYHSHSAYVSGKNPAKLAIYKYYKSVISKYATHFFACSHAASEWMFQKSVIEKNRDRIIHNGIDTGKFRFESKLRDAIRKEFNITDETIYVHAGRFCEQKNQLFILSVFQEIRKTNQKSKLIFLGNGPMFSEVKSEAEKCGLGSDVILAGVRNDINAFLSAADVYLMPSLYEGLPVAAVEAQCAGLPCFLSENITKEVALTDRVFFHSLSDGAKNWADTIATALHTSENGSDTENTGFASTDGRETYADTVKSRDYDVADVSRSMEEFYLGCFGKENSGDE